MSIWKGKLATRVSSFVQLSHKLELWALELLGFELALKITLFMWLWIPQSLGGSYWTKFWEINTPFSLMFGLKGELFRAQRTPSSRDPGLRWHRMTHSKTWFMIIAEGQRSDAFSMYSRIVCSGHHLCLAHSRKGQKTGWCLMLLATHS